MGRTSSAPRRSSAISLSSDKSLSQRVETPIRKERTPLSSIRPAGLTSKAALLALVVFLVAVPALANHFVNFDDYLYLGNTSVKAGLTSAGAVLLAPI